MANLTKIVKISWANYQTLKNGGSVSGQTYDANAIYLIEDNGALDIGDGSNMTADMKSYILENPATPVLYNGNFYLPQTQLDAGTLYVYYNYLESGTNTWHWIGINWDELFVEESGSRQIALKSDLSSYLPLTGGTMTGYLVLNNGVAIQAKNASGTALNLLYVNTNNTIRFGNTSLGAISVTNKITPNATDTYNLGESTLQWNNIYGKTLYENGIALGSKYVTISGKTMSGYLGTYQNNMKYYSWVDGGFANYSGNQTGKIFIKLPADIPYGMIKFKVGIYNYVENTSCEFEIAGYTYDTGNWYNVTVNSYGRGEISSRKVTFYKALNNVYAIAIGELDSVWNYPQIVIKDLQVGFSGVSRDWHTGWEISISSTEIENEVYNTFSNNGFLPLQGGTITGNLILNNAIYLRGRNTSGTPFNLIGVTGGNNVAINSTELGNVILYTTIRPNANKSGLIDLGGASYLWRNLYLSGNLSDGTNSISIANIASKTYVDDAIAAAITTALNASY